MAYILGRSNTTFNFDQFVADLIAAIPGARVTKENYYADRIAHTRQVLEKLKMAESCRPFQSLIEAAAEVGLSREVEVPLPSGSMIGRINRLGFMFTHQVGHTCSIAEARSLVDVIRRHPEVSTEAYFNDWGMPNNPQTLSNLPF